jgi:WD40 repeat protein
MRMAKRVLLVLLSSSSFVVALGQEDPLRVTCPAVGIDDCYHDESMEETLRRLELVVLGEVSGSGKDRWSVRIEKVLYGSTLEKTVEFTRGPGGAGRRILALAPPAYVDEIFELKYSLPPSEDEAVTRLCEARLDCNALASCSIVVGKDLEADEDGRFTVEVIRTIGGPPFPAKETILVDVWGVSHRNHERPRVDGETRIYFVGRTTAPRGGRVAIHHAFGRLPADQEDRVKAALGRRGEYPVVVERSGKKSIEVSFRGSIEEAIRILGSERDGAVDLASRFLVRSCASARGAVVATIEKDLFDFAGEGPARFRRLRNLVRVLGKQEKSEESGAIGRLVEAWMSRIPREFGDAPEIHRNVRPWKDEEDLEEVNHGLTWLLQQSEGKPLRDLGDALLKIRGGTRGRVQAEVQLALDVARIEDSLEIEGALSRMTGVQPVRSRTRLRHSGAGITQVAFSHDGKFLATAASRDGVRVWSTDDWSEAGRIDVEGLVRCLSFSPDDARLYVAGDGVHARYDWRKGTIDKVFEGHTGEVSRMELTADGTRMVSASWGDETMRLWDTKTGKILRTTILSDHCTGLALSPDGRRIVRHVENSLYRVESLERGWDLENDLHSLGCMTFTPDGKHLLSLTTVEHGRTRVSLLDADKGFVPTSSATMKDIEGCDLAVSPDGKNLVVGNREGAAWVATLPGVQDARPILGPAPYSRTIQSIRFSPDGRFLAIARDESTPRLFKADSFEEIFPAEGHIGVVEGIFFSTDGKTIRTLGSERSVCTWDSSTLKPLARALLPAGTTEAFAREPEGKVVLCLGEGVAKVFDVESGKVVSELAVLSDRFHTLARWVNDREAVIASEGKILRIDCMDGKVLQASTNSKAGSRGVISEDGRSIFVIDGGVRTDGLKGNRIDVETGLSSLVGEATLDRPMGNRCGLVPGGRACYVGNPGLHFFDQQTMKPLFSRSFKGLYMHELAFDPGGSRYALVTEVPYFTDDGFRKWDPATPNRVRVYDVATGRIRVAFPASTRWTMHLKFSPDGKRLAVANDDGTIELWPLPEP